MNQIHFVSIPITWDLKGFGPIDVATIFKHIYHRKQNQRINTKNVKVIRTQNEIKNIIIEPFFFPFKINALVYIYSHVQFLLKIIILVNFDKYIVENFIKFMINNI